MTDDRVKKLSDRQLACLRLFYSRMSVKEIGRQLDLSPATVKYHLSNARNTLGVQSTAEAARLAFGERPPADYPDGIVPSEPVAPPIPISDQDDGRRDTPMPFPTPGRPKNDLSARTRLIQATAIAIAVLSLGVLAAALLQSVSQILAKR